MQQLLCSLLLAGALGSPAFAQAPASPAAAAGSNTPAGNTPAADASDEAGLRRSLDLPFAARDLRARGVAEADVRASLGAMKDAKVPAGEAAEVTEAAAADAGQHGPVDNFGAFVQAQLASGLRGQALAAAIKAEHAAHGKGKPAGGHEGHGHADGAHGGAAPHGEKAEGAHGGGTAAGAEHGHGHGHDGASGGDKPHGRPEGAGKPAGGPGKSDEKTEKGGGK